LVRALVPTPQVLATSHVPVVVTTTPPASEPSVPTVSTRPAPRHVQQIDAVATAFCATFHGAWPGEPTACTHMPPGTVMTVGPALGNLTQCFFNPTQVTLTGHDASGSGLAFTEYSLDGTHFTRYTAPFLAPEAAIISYRSTDNAGNVEDTRLLTVPRSELSVALPGLPLFAQGTLAIDDDVRVVTSSNAPAPIANGGSGQTTIGVTADTGDVFSAGPVWLRDRSRVDGNVVTSEKVTFQNEVTVTGSVSQGAAVKLPDFSGCTASFPALTENVNLEPDQTRSIDPGAYASVTAKSRSSLLLRSGIYYLDSLGIEPQARVVLDQSAGPVFLLIRNQFDPKGSFRDSTGALTNAFVTVFGTQSVVMESAYRGTIVAPNAAVTFRGLTPGLTGAVFARDIEVSPRGSVVLQRFDFWNGSN
jgi:hypothetical protein